MLVERALRRQASPGRPRHLELRRRLNGLPWLLGDHADEIALGDDLHHASHAGDRGFIDPHDRRAHRRRPDDAAVEHPGHAHVMHVLELGGDHRRHVDARHRFAEDRPLARPAALRRGTEVDAEAAATDEIAVSDPLARRGAHEDGAVADGELLGRDTESLGCHPHERLAGGGAGQCEIRLVEVGRVRLRAGCRPLIGRQRGVALHEANTVHRHDQFFGDELHLRGEKTLTELALARVGRHRAIRHDADPAVEGLGGAAVDALRGGRAGRPGEAEPVGRAEGDNERSGALQEVAAREPGRLVGGARVRRQVGRHAVLPSA